jgi:phosphopantothenoylcysteine decarboxylase / phosphopantothenate---cysteine ligase
MPGGRTLVVGVSGGIAAYKACELVRRLQDRGDSVVVVMTAAATEFVTPLTFQALTGNPVVTSMWGDQSARADLPAAAKKKMRGRVGHVDLAEAADAIVLAPATADLIARIVHGEAPDALTSLVLASRAPVVVAPAMDREMWAHPATVANLRLLRARGAVVVEPVSGPLASGLDGPGRLAEIPTIVEAVERVLDRRASLDGLRVLVTAGRTEEPIDPVRVLTNRSSGRMGVALVEAARQRGAEVTMVAGGMSVDVPLGVTVVRVSTASEMEKAVLEHAAGADVVLMAAAVADYRPIRESREKMKRKAETMTLTLAPNPDILARAALRRKPGQLFIGFALETSRGLERARGKLRAKKLDLVVLNMPASSIGRETNRVTLVEAKRQERVPEMTKREVAERVLDRVLELRGARRGAKRGAKR